MERSPELLLRQAAQLFKRKKYQEIIALLNDAVLTRCNDAALYTWRARAHDRMGDTSLNVQYSQKAIEINSSYAMAYLARGNAWYDQQDYTKAIEDFNNAIFFDSKNIDFYNNRGNAWSELGKFHKAIEDYSYAIDLDAKDSYGYYNRGLAWADLKDFRKAIADYCASIRRDKNDSYAYNALGVALAELNENSKAIVNYNKAIKFDKTHADAYYNRGLAWSELKEFKKAIGDYEKVIALDENYNDAYYARAIANEKIGRYHQAVEDYKHFIAQAQNPEDFYVQIAVASIKELRKKVSDTWYNDIDLLVGKIKSALLFEETHLTHYTTLSGCKAMILDNSSFRLSEGAFLNDTSEGRELFEYLSFASYESGSDEETVSTRFTERPFIGSFVANNKNDDLALWRMYGKEALAEAKGCSLTIWREQFINNLKQTRDPGENKATSAAPIEGRFTFYNVAYRNGQVFRVTGNSQVERRLNKLMEMLKVKVARLKKQQRTGITKLLNDIAYLFKSTEYQYENEVRLVVQGAGFKKQITSDSTPPKVYIELINIVPVLHKIVLGPKVDRPDEWAAAFNYHIKEQFPNKTEDVEIVISHLPFK